MNKHTYFFILVFTSYFSNLFGQSVSVVESDWQKSNSCVSCFWCECISCGTTVYDRDLHGNEYKKEGSINIPLERSTKIIKAYCDEKFIGEWKIIKENTCNGMTYYSDIDYRLIKGIYKSSKIQKTTELFTRKSILRDIQNHCQNGEKRKNRKDIEDLLIKNAISEYNKLLERELDYAHYFPKNILPYDSIVKTIWYSPRHGRSYSFYEDNDLSRMDLSDNGKKGFFKFSVDSSYIELVINERGDQASSEIISFSKDKKGNYILYSSNFPTYSSSPAIKIRELGKSKYMALTLDGEKIQKAIKSAHYSCKYIQPCNECFWDGVPYRIGDSISIKSHFFGKKINFKCMLSGIQPIWSSTIFDYPYFDTLDVGSLCINYFGYSPGAYIESANSTSYIMSFRDLDGVYKIHPISDDDILNIPDYLNDYKFELDSLNGKWEMRIETFKERVKGKVKKYGIGYVEDKGNLEFVIDGNQILGKIITITRGLAENIPIKGTIVGRKFEIIVQFPKRSIKFKGIFYSNNFFKGSWQPTKRKYRNGDFWAYIYGERAR